MSKEIQYIFDELKNKYTVGDLCGSGGQGSTYFVKKDPTSLIKIVKKSYGDIAKRIKEINFLNIDEKVRIAKPIISIASPYKGYIMRFLENMEPIKNILSKSSKERFVEYFNRTSSISRRYKILRALCETLCYLEERNIVYCDLSPNNIFVSKDKDDYEVYLIDGDNLHKEGRKVFGHHLSIGTQQYMAPEIARGEPNTVKSDEFSFATIVFKLLTLITPFDGQALIASEADCGWDQTTSEKGEVNYFNLPWVGNKKNTTNRQVSGIPYSLTLTDELYELCRANFEEGLNNPKLRPNIHDWLKPLKKAECSCVALPISNSTEFFDIPFHFLKSNIKHLRSDISFEGMSLFSLNRKMISYYYVEGKIIKKESEKKDIEIYAIGRNNRSIALKTNSLLDTYRNNEEELIRIEKTKNNYFCNMYYNNIGEYVISISNKDKYFSKLTDLEIIVGRKNDKHLIYKYVYFFNEIKIGSLE